MELLSYGLFLCATQLATKPQKTRDQAAARVLSGLYNLDVVYLVLKQPLQPSLLVLG